MAWGPWLGEGGRGPWLGEWSPWLGGVIVAYTLILCVGGVALLSLLLLGILQTANFHPEGSHSPPFYPPLFLPLPPAPLPLLLLP